MLGSAKRDKSNSKSQNVVEKSSLLVPLMEERLDVKYQMKGLLYKLQSSVICYGI